MFWKRRNSKNDRGAEQPAPSLYQMAAAEVRLRLARHMSDSLQELGRQFDAGRFDAETAPRIEALMNKAAEEAQRPPDTLTAEEASEIYGSENSTYAQVLDAVALGLDVHREVEEVVSRDAPETSDGVEAVAEAALGEAYRGPAPSEPHDEPTGPEPVQEDAAMAEPDVTDSREGEPEPAAEPGIGEAFQGTADTFVDWLMANGLIDDPATGSAEPEVADTDTMADAELAEPVEEPAGTEVVAEVAENLANTEVAEVTDEPGETEEPAEVAIEAGEAAPGLEEAATEAAEAEPEVEEAATEAAEAEPEVEEAATEAAEPEEVGSEPVEVEPAAEEVGTEVTMVEVDVVETEVTMVEVETPAGADVDPTEPEVVEETAATEEPAEPEVVEEPTEAEPDVVEEPEELKPVDDDDDDLDVDGP